MREKDDRNVLKPHWILDQIEIDHRGLDRGGIEK
jgi:hypothetical protein